MSTEVITNARLFRFIQRFIGESFPGDVAQEIIIKLKSGGEFRSGVPDPNALHRDMGRKKRRFTPNVAQLAMLTALDSKACKTSELARAIGGDERRVFRKPGGIHELIEHGMVEHRKGIGYFRPDAPPDGMRDS